MDKFPESRFDDLTLLASTLGNFWTELFEGRELVFDYLRGGVLQERQLEQLADELFDSMGRQTCPVYHTDRWLPVELREDEGVAAGRLRYDDGAVYGPQPDTGVTYAYGSSRDPSWEFPAPPDLREVYFLADGLVDPGVCLTAGVEFYLSRSRQTLVFIADPFDDPRFRPYVGDDGVRRVRVYLFMAGSDWNYVPKLYGSVLGLNGRSSAAYKDLVNVALDAVAGGTGVAEVGRAFEAMTGVPLARGDETVEEVTSDAGGLLVITDRNVYRYAAAATPLVTAGDVVTRGQPLVDALQVFEPNGGDVPAVLSRLSVGKGLLMTPSDTELVFENKELPVSVTTGVSGKTKLTFPLGVHLADAFFAEMHARGVAAGKTLANYLDLRPQPQSTEPTALNLPATVNPLRLLFANLLRYAVVVVYVKLRDVSADGAGLDKAQVLRRFVPPHATVLVIFDLQDLSDDVNMDGDGDESSTGCLESYEVYVA